MMYRKLEVCTKISRDIYYLKFKNETFIGQYQKDSQNNLIIKHFYKI
jgi:hypothetical protein